MHGTATDPLMRERRAGARPRTASAPSGSDRRSHRTGKSQTVAQRRRDRSAPFAHGVEVAEIPLGSTAHTGDAALPQAEPIRLEATGEGQVILRLDGQEDRTDAVEIGQPALRQDGQAHL